MKRKSTLALAVTAAILMGGGAMVFGKKAEVPEINVQPALMAALPIEADAEAPRSAVLRPDALCKQPPCGEKRVKPGKAGSLSEDDEGFALGVGGPSDVGARTGSSGSADDGNSAHSAGAQQGIAGMRGGALGAGSGGGFLGGFAGGGSASRQNPATVANSGSVTVVDTGAANAGPGENGRTTNSSPTTTASNAAPSETGGHPALSSEGAGLSPASSPTDTDTPPARELAPDVPSAPPVDKAPSPMGGAPGDKPLVVAKPNDLPPVIDKAPDLHPNGPGIDGTPLELAPQPGKSPDKDPAPQVRQVAQPAAVPNVLPEPGSIALMGAALCALFIGHRRRTTVRRATSIAASLRLPRK